MYNVIYCTSHLGELVDRDGRATLLIGFSSRLGSGGRAGGVELVVQVRENLEHRVRPVASIGEKPCKSNTNKLLKEIYQK